MARTAAHDAVALHALASTTLSAARAELSAVHHALAAASDLDRGMPASARLRLLRKRRQTRLKLLRSVQASVLASSLV